MLLIWVTGGLMLLAGGLLTYLLNPRKANEAPFRVHLHGNRRVLRLMRRILRTSHSQQYTHSLQAAAPSLTDSIRRMNQRIASLPSLPAAPDGEPRLMDAARDAADSSDINGDTLLDSLRDNAFDSMEIRIFPICVACAESHRLAAVLTSLLADVRQANQAQHLLKRLRRSKHPEQILQKSTLNSFGLNVLFQALKGCHADKLLEMVEDQLLEMDLQPDDLVATAAQRIRRYDEEIRRARDCFVALQRMDWQDLCSTADTAHSQLLADPGGVYPRLETAAQLQLRLDISNLSRRTAMPAVALIQQAFILCGQASESSLESCVCYYFQDPQGLSTLHRSLPTHRGRLYVRLKGRGELLRYIAAWTVALVTGLGFLQSGQPVFILPFFLLLVGGIFRASLGTHQKRMPGMRLVHGDQALRTLVVLHANMAEPQDAASAVQRLKTTIRSLYGEQADFLLIGDFAPCITAVSGFDLPVMQSANAAVAALENSRVIYLHRGRAWDDSTHCYRARAGQRGAITEVCRLIASGECHDTLAYSTVVPSALERRYAYVLALGDDVKPAPGMLTRFLSVMAHPLCQAYPQQKGIRGHALLLPQGDITFEGTAFIRPDMFLEAVDGRLHDRSPASALCGELAGQMPIDGAQVFRPVQPATWERQYHRTLRAWQLIPWQLSIVSTPSGWIDNPLSFFQRFHLRELLRPSLVPLSQIVMLLWGLLTGNWPLMLLALLLPEMGRPLRGREDFFGILCRISLLPTKVAVDIVAVVQLIRRKPERLPDWASMEAWVQGLSATLMAALIFLLPAGGAAAFALTVLFACFPLAHRFTDV